MCNTSVSCVDLQLRLLISKHYLSDRHQGQGNDRRVMYELDGSDPDMINRRDYVYEAQGYSNRGSAGSGSSSSNDLFFYEDDEDSDSSTSYSYGSDQEANEGKLKLVETFNPIKKLLKNSMRNKCRRVLDKNYLLKSGLLTR